MNKSLSNPENYNCFVLDLFWKIVKKFDESDEIIAYFQKKGLKKNLNLPSSIIYQASSFNSKLLNFYEFPKIEEGALIKKSITEYEIPQYIPDMPQGFSLFCTLWEATKVRQYLQLNQEEKNNLFGIEPKEEDDKNLNNILDEPVPKNNFCHICMRKFDDYLIHIETLSHKNNIVKNSDFIKRANNTFERINTFWQEKQKEKEKEKNEIENINTPDNKQLKIDHNKINSISSFSSSVSTFKIDESVSLFKSTSFFLEQELNESEKNKENINENTTKKVKSLKNKNKNIFNTPKSKTDCKYSSYFSSCQSNYNFFLNKKRQLYLDEEKDEKNGDYFKDLNTKKTKKLIRNKDVFFK